MHLNFEDSESAYDRAEKHLNSCRDVFISAFAALSESDSGKDPNRACSFDEVQIAENYRAALHTLGLAIQAFEQAEEEWLAMMSPERN